MNDKRLIEETFPVKEVSFHSAKEKSIRHGHISTLHIWWARRPLASSRATAYAALIPVPKTEKELEEEKKFIAEFSQWENTNNSKFIEKARKKILEANGGKPPKVLDPFGGGGSIPLECLRLGCETYSNDLNPVAVLLQKCTLEYPQKYGKPGYVEREVVEFGKKKTVKLKVDNVLFEDVKHWGEWVLQAAKKKLIHFYPLEQSNTYPIAYIWARTITCQNPACKIEIPLMRQFWLSKKSNKRVALYPYIEDKIIKFKIVGDGYDKMPGSFNPEFGTISRATVKCPKCNAILESDGTRKLFQEKKASERLIAVVFSKDNHIGKFYRVATTADYKILGEISKIFNDAINNFKNKWGFNPIPDEEMNVNDPNTVAGRGYGISYWGELFNLRQRYSLLIFLDIIKSLETNLNTYYLDSDYRNCILSFLALNLDRLASYCSSFGYWHVTGEKLSPAMQRQAIAMVYDYAESNPFAESYSWSTNLEWILRVIKSYPNDMKPAIVNQMSANKLIFSDNTFDFVCTDPPYYDNVNYAELSDFYYVWLKRAVGNLYPEIFSTPLVPKKQEIVANPIRQGSKTKAKEFFETNLINSFTEIYRVLKDNGLAVIVYAHKSTSGWETLINSLLSSHLIITSAWPIKTEMTGKLDAHETASLMSSIYITARKSSRLPTAFYSDTKEEIKSYLNIKMDKLWNEGITGADFFIAAIGASIEIFGKYEKVIDFEGKQIRADKLLQDVRVIVTDYAVRKILHNGFASEISDLTRFYILMRWEFGIQKVEFDEANKLAHSCHIDLAEEWTKKSSFIKKDKEFISILGPQERDIEDLEDSSELIDVLHLSLKYWEKNRKAELNTLLRVSGFGKSDAFFRVAQAIAETLPPDNKEKKLLEGFLNLREKIITMAAEPKTKYNQGKLEFPENE